MEPRYSRIPKIEAFLGYQVENGLEDIPSLIESICKETALSCYELESKIGVSAETLFNLKSGRYGSTRRTYRAIKSYAEEINLT